ncbi:hypothetical protein HK104_001897 [Borealophlyctis nickersoniae]|nr:hypothetical protein HK104_001897 [Borealophlyctis nickersoniae]
MATQQPYEVVEVHLEETYQGSKETYQPLPGGAHFAQDSSATGSTGLYRQCSEYSHSCHWVNDWSWGLPKVVGASALMPIALLATLVALVLFAKVRKVVKCPLALGGAIAILVSFTCQIIAIILVKFTPTTDLEGVFYK